MTFKSTWTDDRVEALKRLWLEGKGATEVAASLNATFGSSYSRAAVFLKVERLGIKRPAKVATWSPARRRATPAKPRRERKPFKRPPLDPIEQTRRLIRRLLAEDSGRDPSPMTLPTIHFLDAA
jgi:hypothetical protein